MTLERHIYKSFGRLGKVRTIFSSTIKFYGSQVSQSCSTLEIGNCFLYLCSWQAVRLKLKRN
uniref:Putative ovule protein n=1 Tax=Solanum chacoense TaxID=4108 RepID=A0A0V0GGR0_SOLCH